MKKYTYEEKERDHKNSWINCFHGGKTLFLYKNNHECCWDYKWETKTLKLFVIITIPDHSLPTSGPASGSCLIQPKEKETKKNPFLHLFLFINIAADSAELARSAAHPKSFAAKSIIIITSGDEFPVMVAQFAAACTHNDILLSLAGLPCR